MRGFRNGSIQLFRVAGIDVFLHWSWLAGALYFIDFQAGGGETVAWQLAAYVTLFAIVLLHEFGHAFACRSVGGTAKEIMLWPLGGIAFVAPPPRPGALLWSIAAGPLVNVVLLPILLGAFGLAVAADYEQVHPNFYVYLRTIAGLNAGLLFFNILPVYPLDGGQILQSVLWFMIGRPKSLIISGAIGMVVGALAVVAAIMTRDWMFGLVGGFVATQAWAGVRMGRFLSRIEKLPRREELHCPACGQAPVLGDHWLCRDCQRPYDVFADHGRCPHCGYQTHEIACPFCARNARLATPAEHAAHPQADWA